MLVSVSDTGCGMDDEAKIHALDPYFSTKEMGPRKGLGLGLSITHSLIEEAGGSLDVESSSDGTTFTMRFPIVSGLEHEVPRQANA